MDAVFFDLDGTLLATATDVIGCMQQTFKKLGIGADGFLQRFRIGPPLYDAIREAIPSIQDEQLQEFATQFRQLYDSIDYPETRPYDGIIEMLTALKRQGTRLFIATNKRMVPTLRLVKKFNWESFFDSILTFNMYPDRKLSKVEMLAEALARGGFSPDRCAMVGDAATDIQAGNDSHVLSVAVTWGYDSRESLLAARPDKIVDTVSQLKELLLER